MLFFGVRLAWRGGTSRGMSRRCGAYNDRIAPSLSNCLVNRFSRSRWITPNVLDGVLGLPAQQAIEKRLQAVLGYREGESRFSAAALRGELEA
jgi:hypothetical protein